jgi:hypothetical protein
MYIKSPEDFAEKFNVRIPDACRKITSNDVRLMTDCKLIGRYRFYGRQDLETVRGILLYEKLREKRSTKQGKDKELPSCKRCGQPIPLNLKGMLGRHKEYCPECESFRNTERQRHYRCLRGR